MFVIARRHKNTCYKELCSVHSWDMALIIHKLVGFLYMVHSYRYTGSNKFKLNISKLILIIRNLFHESIIINKLDLVFIHRGLVIVDILFVYEIWTPPSQYFHQKSEFAWPPFSPLSSEVMIKKNQKKTSPYPYHLRWQPYQHVTKEYNIIAAVTW